jgi:hypothetical protein
MLQISFRAFREIFSPRSFEVGPRLVEARRGVLDMLTVMRRRVKATLPAPLIDVDRDTGAGRDSADVNIAVEDVPAIGAIGWAAAGEGGHTRHSFGALAGASDFRMPAWSITRVKPATSQKEGCSQVTKKDDSFLWFNVLSAAAWVRPVAPESVTGSWFSRPWRTLHLGCSGLKRWHESDEYLTQQEPEPADQATEVVSDGCEDSVGSVASTVPEVVAIHAMLGFEMADHGFDGGPAT